MEEDIGYIKGKLDTVQEENNRDHEEIKLSLMKQGDKVQLICEQVNELHLTTARHEVAINKIGGRVEVIEVKQRYVDAIGRFIAAHPRLVVTSLFALIFLLAGISAEEIWKYVKG